MSFDFDFTEVLSFFYNPLENYFEDEDGEIAWDILEFITPNDLFLFRHNEESIIVPNRQNRNLGIELLYPVDGDCRFCDLFYSCASGYDEDGEPFDYDQECGEY